MTITHEEFFRRCLDVHGNPRRYSPSSLNEVTGLPFSVLYEKTKSKEAAILKCGYNLVVQWETPIT